MNAPTENLQGVRQSETDLLASFSELGTDRMRDTCDRAEQMGYQWAKDAFETEPNGLDPNRGAYAFLDFLAVAQRSGALNNLELEETRLRHHLEFGDTQPPYWRQVEAFANGWKRFFTEMEDRPRTRLPANETELHQMLQKAILEGIRFDWSQHQGEDLDAIAERMYPINRNRGRAAAELVIEQVQSVESNAHDLTSYAAGDALRQLGENWTQALTDDPNTTLEKLLPDLAYLRGHTVDFENTIRRALNLPLVPHEGQIPSDVADLCRLAWHQAHDTTHDQATPDPKEHSARIRETIRRICDRHGIADPNTLC